MLTEGNQGAIQLNVQRSSKSNAIKIVHQQMVFEFITGYRSSILAEYILCSVPKTGVPFLPTKILYLYQFHAHK